MGRVFELRPIETLKGIEPEDTPFSMWLPYLQLDSERFVCDETKEVWLRIKGASLLCEDEDNPEDDLVDDYEEVPEGLVCWQSKSKASPEVGDVFRVMDGNCKVLFEEVISDNVVLHGRKYAAAEKQSDFTVNLVRELEQNIRNILNGGDDGYSVYSRLKEISSDADNVQEKIPVSLRGMGFDIVLNEFAVSSDVIMNFYHYEDKKLIRTEQEIASGDKWYQTRIYASGDEKNYISVCWGLGSVEETVQKIREGLYSTMRSVDNILEDACQRHRDGSQSHSTKEDKDKIF